MRSKNVRSFLSNIRVPAELHEHGQIEREASLDQVDYSMQSLVIFASHFYGP